MGGAKRGIVMDKWDKRFMQLTEQVATWSSCLRRKVGAVIVKDIGAKVVMTTHSPQLLMAMEGVIEDYDIHADCYDLMMGQDGIEFSGPLLDLQPVYGRMAKPISEAGSRFLRT